MAEWDGQLAKLREELSVRQIAKEISAARVPYTVKVLAYRNGDGRMKPGELIVGSSVPGVSLKGILVSISSFLLFFTFVSSLPAFPLHYSRMIK